MIDTLALAERLEREYGDDPERARRHARILGDMLEAGDVATKAGHSGTTCRAARGRTASARRTAQGGRRDRLEDGRFTVGPRSRDRGIDQAVARGLTTIDA